jgi:hypothetical protein
MLKERRSQNKRLARAVTPHVGRGGRDIDGGMGGWMAWGDRTDGADVCTTKRWIHSKRCKRLFCKK